MNGSDIQVEKGNYTRIHNAILEALSFHDFTGREYACILYLLRMTYGFSRKDAKLSNGDFAKATDLDRTAIIKTLRRLVERNVIVKDEGDPYHAATWSFNKYVEQWDAQTSVKTTTSQNDTSSRFDTTSSGQNDTSASVETTTSYISAKESIKERKQVVVPAPAAPALSSEATKYAAFVAAIEQTFATTITVTIADFVGEWVNAVTETEWAYALGECKARQNRFNAKYTAAILRRVVAERITPAAPVENMPVASGTVAGFNLAELMGGD